MKITKLNIHNFLAIGNSPELSLDDRGLVLIQGKNEDDSSANSNGVGKSSIFDALCWALYGTTARGLTGDAVVNRTAKKDTRVMVELEDGEVTYQISRHRKHSEYKNATVVYVINDATAEQHEITKGTEKETQALIEQIIGCSQEVFMAAIYAGQEQMPDLPGMTDKQLKLLIEEAAGVNCLERAYAIARQDVAVVETKLASVQRTYADKKMSLENLNVKVALRQREFEDFEAGRESRRDAAVAATSSLKEEIEKQTKALAGMREDAINQALEDIGFKLSDYRKLMDKKNELLAAAQKLDKSVAVLRAEYDRAMKRVTTAKTALENAPEEMKKPCPECGKPHTEDELAVFVAHKKDALREAADSARELKARVAQATEQYDAAMREHDEFAKTIPEMGEIIERQRKLNLAKSKIGEIRDTIRVLQRDLDRALEGAETEMTRDNPHAGSLETLRELANNSAAELAAIEGEIAENESLRDELKAVVDVFAPSGVRAHILDTVTPFLNEKTAEYLAVLSDGNINAVWTTLSTTAKGEMREKFTIEVASDKGAASFAGLSGGEKRKVRLATMLALQDLVASRATKPIDLWLGDEVDDALDNAGLERLMSLLDAKARERGTVLVVSHNDLRDWIDESLSVTKCGGYSTFEGALCG